MLLGLYGDHIQVLSFGASGVLCASCNKSCEGLIVRVKYSVGKDYK